MLALFTKSWRKKAAIIALVFYTLVIVAPAFALTDGGAHCLAKTTAQAADGARHRHAGASHDHHEATADQGPHSTPSTDDRDMTVKCCGAFCLTALAASVAPVAAPLMCVTAISQLCVVPLFGLGSDPIDRPPRNLLSI